jgi:hypothetical protein
MAREVGLEPLQVACELVLDGNVVTASVVPHSGSLGGRQPNAKVMNEMRRLLAPTQPMALNVPDMLKLQLEPLADCARYDHLRGASRVLH